MNPILKYKSVLRIELDDFLRAKQTEQMAGEWGSEFLKRLRPFASSGKLLRGSLVCFSYQAWSGRKPSKAVISTALALELAHSGLLIHDDIMDGDELRRGQPSMHRQYELVASRRHLTDPPGFGTSMALSGGDIALFLAFELLNRSGNPTVRKLFTEQLLATCGGQMQDVYLGTVSGEPNEAEIYKVMAQKTAGYTLALPLMMGAALADQSRQTLDRLQSIGLIAGTIFQIRDDELGALGNQQQTGKPVGADIRENKKTLLRHHLMKRCTKDEGQKLAVIFGNSSATYTDIRFIQSLLRKYEIPEMLAAEIESLRQKVHDQIEQLKINGSSKQAFRSLVDFCSERQL